MTISELITKIENVDYLSQDEKDNWLELIPNMDIGQLRQLAYVIEWEERQTQKMQSEKETILTKLASYQARTNVHGHE